MIKGFHVDAQGVSSEQHFWIVDVFTESGHFIAWISLTMEHCLAENHYLTPIELDEDFLIINAPIGFHFVRVKLRNDVHISRLYLNYPISMGLRNRSTYLVD